MKILLKKCLCSVFSPEDEDTVNVTAKTLQVTRHQIKTLLHVILSHIWNSAYFRGRQVHFPITRVSDERPCQPGLCTHLIFKWVVRYWVLPKPKLIWLGNKWVDPTHTQTSGICWVWVFYIKMTVGISTKQGHSISTLPRGRSIHSQQHCQSLLYRPQTLSWNVASVHAPGMMIHFVNLCVKSAMKRKLSRQWMPASGSGIGGRADLHFNNTTLTLLQHT